MLFGRSVFQSVVERLQNERLAEGDAPAPPSDAKPRMSTSVIFDTARDTAEQDRLLDPASAYRNLVFEWDEAQADKPNAEVEALHIEDGPGPETTAPVQEQHHQEPPTPAAKRDYSYLSNVSLAQVQKELGLNALKSIDALQAKRRQFARDNHPDMVPDQHRVEATARMTAANLLIDQAIKYQDMASRLGG